MPLAAGTRLGPYEISTPLGAGGMGEVYRARDSRLGRDVAIKILPASLSSSSETRARFEREARIVSSLNHPHICTLHDVGREGETDFLVMELVEGETLAERLARGALPTPEVLKLGGQIADALDRAHRAGVIHRDLKPGNVMLTKGGAKLMDFGLARATGLAGPASGSGATVAALTQSPTMAAPLTAEGTIVGTFQYMSPEQLEGKEADARSDLWALGCVLYEMATGRRAFEGRSQASLIGAIMHSEPPSLVQVAPATPPALDRLVHACLAKDPEERIQTAHDVSLQLRWIQEGASQSGIPAPVAVPGPPRPLVVRFARGALPVLLAGLVVFVAQRLLSPPAPATVLRFDVAAGPSIAIARWPVLSPDGRTLAFLGTDSAGTTQYWVRPMDALEAHPLPGVRVQRPFWSRDGRSLGYFALGSLHRVDLSGRTDVVVAETPGGADGSWGDGVVLYDGSGSDSLRRVALPGGKVEAATTLDRARGETGHSWPHFLPDGKHFLFVCTVASQNVLDIKLGTLGSLASKVVGHTDSRAQYAPPGYLLSTSGGTLLAQKLDARSGRTSGDPVAIGERIAGAGGTGEFTVSGTGVLAYRVAGSTMQSRLVWVDRTGRLLGEAAPPDRYDEVRLSPDGRRVAVRILQGQSSIADIWIRDLARGVSSRITFGSTDNLWPVWSPDGSRLAYGSNRGGEYHLLIRSASGAGGEDSLPHEPGGNDGPTDWSADGRTLAVSRLSSGWALWLQPLDPRAAPNKLLQARHNQRYGRISPDGHWLAYASNESGRYEIYVMPLSGAAGKWQVSTSGGDDPFWRADGQELLYRAPDRTINAVAIGTGQDFEPGTPQPLFRAELAEGVMNPALRWCPTADAQRFLVEAPIGGAKATSFTVVSGWPTELRKKP